MRITRCQPSRLIPQLTALALRCPISSTSSRSASVQATLSGSCGAFDRCSPGADLDVSPSIHPLLDEGGIVSMRGAGSSQPSHPEADNSQFRASVVSTSRTETCGVAPELEDGCFASGCRERRPLIPDDAPGGIRSTTGC